MSMVFNDNTMMPLQGKYLTALLERMQIIPQQDTPRNSINAYSLNNSKSHFLVSRLQDKHEYSTSRKTMSSKKLDRSF